MLSVVIAVLVCWSGAAALAQQCSEPLPPASLLEHPDHPVVRFCTDYGAIDIELFSTAAPNTVANFLRYVQDGDYDGSIFHRLDDDFVLQGGGFTFADGEGFTPVPADPPIPNEFNRSNVARTVAMARVGGQPHSATSQFYINLVDNTFLDTVDLGFTVFGRVLDESSWAVVQAIHGLPIVNLGSPFNELPVQDHYNGADGLQQHELVDLRMTVLCRADFDGDGVVAVPDIFAFLSAWFVGSYPAADYNGDQAIDVADIFAFLAAWFAGCP